MEPFVSAEKRDKPGVYLLAEWMERVPGLTAGFTSRLGGVSYGAFDSLNCGLHVADDPDDVVRNREILAETVGIPLGRWTFGEQVHGTRVAVVTEEDRGRGTTERASAFGDTDAFVTDRTELCLAALFADCVPLYFLDPEHRVVGIAHAGWKGTVGCIAEAVVQTMQERFGSRPGELLAAVGPSIGPCCYEVDDRVADRVRGLLKELPEAADAPTHPILRPAGEGHAMLDLQRLNRQIMIKAGILPSRIELTSLCTSCRTDAFFSHRKEQGKTGRMLAWIGWRSGDNRTE
ncbi:laccase domain protein [Paenibacillus sp. J31TS4]|uniref:peptidoglycan editing factor PgeF n=1 Tax=Paenibacillus sp. J31TS4 TaxID=2807195 RepID=UPI001B2DB01A|nr:peptidoglycan editing factor PgeF [Paenibacillus sp. J31TS4]GIP39689.1 laccase domain protein [Paenibacillus sp. J31TS4]